MRGLVPFFDYGSLAKDPRARVVTDAVLVGLVALVSGGFGITAAEDAITGLASLVLVPTGIVLLLVAGGLKLDLPFVWGLAVGAFTVACLCGAGILAGHATGVATTFQTGVGSGFTLPLAVFFGSLMGLADLLLSRDSFGSQSREERKEMVENRRRNF